MAGAARWEVGREVGQEAGRSATVSESALTTPAPSPRGCFVTGTDTGVGKTLVSAGLIWALRRHHARVVGMKPVAAGLVLHEGAWVSEDVLALRAASSLAVPAELDNPVALPEPLSPHLAAERAGRHVPLALLQERCVQLQACADFVVVEGAGGWLVPLNEAETLADLAAALALPVVMVVGLRLGCLNHALLSAQAIAASGLTLAGWVANRIDTDMACPEDNLRYLERHLAAPCLGRIPWLAQPDPRNLKLILPVAWTPSAAAAQDARP
jgi:dethiobiotin synthetase